MRIISGTHKSRMIHPPVNLPLRPTTDFAKTGLFNILNNYFELEKITVLDLFCGTGNISFEFASRGAKKIVAVDENFNCIRFVKETSEKFVLQNIHSFRSDVLQFIKTCDQKFDLVFADPPYEMSSINSLIDTIFEKNIIHKSGWLILEHSAKNDFSQHAAFFRKQKYGSVNFSFFRLESC